MKKSLIALMTCVLLVGCMPALAGQIEGTVKPFMCVIYGISCPINQEDPVAATAEHIIVYTDEGKYYFVLNVSNRILARHMFGTVRITGDVKGKYNAIYADSLEAYDEGEWVKTWTTQMEETIRQIPNDIEKKARQEQNQHKSDK
ncbi:MAG: hypothetical protein HY788_00205 [Deltaproteobacteria bacterium]|nr:hypothetical protein [Deltaproteobacteria bacterium]